MKILFVLIYSGLLLASTKELSKDQWKSKIDSLLPNDPDSVYSDLKLQISEEQKTQSQLYLIPKLDLFHSSTISKGNTSFKNHSYGLSAQVNIFQFGKSHYNYLGQRSFFEVATLEHTLKRIQIENQYLLTLFKNTLLQRKLGLYRQIESLKRKGLKVAQQRFDRGNLPRQQVDKVEIDLNNLGSQRSAAERELLDSELDVTKFQLNNFKREWPFASSFQRVKKNRKIFDFIDIKILNLKSDAYENYLQSSRRNYLPQVDLQGRTYEAVQDQTRSQDWDISLTVSWPLWDNYSRSISNLNAYRDFQYWQNEKTRVVRDWDAKVQSKEEQLSKLIFQLNQSADNLKKLGALYNDTEVLFSQGRITVNEFFQDQQLLLETQINNENELFAFHEFVLGYCQFYSERVWDCFSQP